MGAKAPQPAPSGPKPSPSPPSPKRDHRQPQYAACGTCGEQWKVCTAPCPLDRFVDALKRAMCPNCGETQAVYHVTTGGPCNGAPV